MKQLRQFLVDTIDLQAQFLIARLQGALPKMMVQAADRENVHRQFDRVASSAQGCYALVAGLKDGMSGTKPLLSPE